jgi:hypothetical protein
LLTHTKDFTSRESYFVAIGGFKFNMTDNTSFVSPPIGSSGCYSGTPSKLGLWTAGEPNSISVSVQRVGYIAMNDGSVSIYNDATTSNAKAVAQLSSYQDGFINNNLIPASQLSQTDLFHPVS